MVKWRRWERRRRRLLEQVHEIVQRAVETLKTMIQGVEQRGVDQLAQTASMIVDLGRRQDEEIQNLQKEIKRLQKDCSEIQRVHQTFISSATDRFNKLYKDVDSKVNEFYKCIDLVKGKRDLDYMTVDEYLLLIEPSRRGPISDKLRQEHETQLDVFMRENGLQPGLVRAPFDRMHHTYPRDVIVDHFNGEGQIPWPPASTGY